MVPGAWCLEKVVTMEGTTYLKGSCDSVTALNTSSRESKTPLQLQHNTRKSS